MPACCSTQHHYVCYMDLQRQKIITCIPIFVYLMTYTIHFVNPISWQCTVVGNASTLIYLVHCCIYLPFMVECSIQSCHLVCCFISEHGISSRPESEDSDCWDTGVRSAVLSSVRPEPQHFNEDFGSFEESPVKQTSRFEISEVPSRLKFFVLSTLWFVLGFLLLLDSMLEQFQWVSFQFDVICI